MEMNQHNQMGTSFPLTDAPLKRKRGRPRKDKSQNPTKSPYVSRKRGQSQNHGESAPIPPGFERANGNQPHPVDKINDNNEDSMVGQVVTGVVEAAFEDGYLVSVRVGDSDTSLRGVVFKPGHYVPISAENDIAPSLQMIRRNVVPFPSVSQSHKRRGRPRTENYATYPSNGLVPANQLAQVLVRPMPIVPAQPPQMTIVPAQSPHPVGARGTLVPVVLQPVSLSNGAALAVEAPRIASQPAHLAALKSKQAPLTTQANSKGSQTDSGSNSQPFEELVSAAKRMQGSSESVETQCESGKSSSKVLPNDCGLNPEQVEDLSKPLLVKPLQAIRSGLQDHSASLNHTFPERRTGKMTELLLAVQENLMERRMVESQPQDFKNPEN